MPSLRSAFRKRWLRRAHGGAYASIKEEPKSRPAPPLRLPGADPYKKPPKSGPVRKHDTPKSPHKEHGPKGKHQGVGQAAHAGRFQPVSTEKGAKALQQAYQDNPRAWNLTPHSVEDLKGSRVFLSHGGKAGFVITGDGELQNVFNNSDTKGLGAAGVKRAIAEGARTLDAYDGFLTPFYEKLGFRETGRVKFDPKYAPPNLPKDIAQKQPDVVFMEYAGDQVKRMPLRGLVRKLEHRQLDRSLASILRKLEGDLMWEITKSIECKGYDRDGQIVVECNG